MRKPLFPILAAVGLTASAGPVVPYTGYYYPSSIPVGETTRVVIGGDRVGAVVGGWVTGEGVKITKIVKVPGFPRATGKTQPAWVVDWAYETLGGYKEHRDLPPEAQAADTDWDNGCPWWSTIDERDQLELEIIVRDRYTPENYPQATPALDHLLILDIEVSPDAKPGLRDIAIYDGRTVSAPHPLYITKEKHAVEPFFVVPPRECYGKKPPVYTLHLPHSLAAQTLPVVLDGQCWPGETDVFELKLKKGIRLTCEINARELLPYLGDAVPGFFNPAVRLVGPSGKEIAQADDFFYLPDPILSCMIPEDGIYKIEIHDNLYRGRSDFVYMIRCYEDDPEGHSYVPQQRAFECYVPPASHIPPEAGSNTVVHTGKIDCPGRVERFSFTVDEPKTLCFDLFARRCGSPLDGVLNLYGPIKPGVPLAATPLLATWDDVDKFLAGSVPQAICDARGSWNFLEAGEYCVTVSDRAGEGGEDYTYTLCISAFEPAFDVYSTQSTFLMRPGGSADFTVKVVRRNGFTGDIRLEGSGDFYFGNDTIPAGEDEASVSVSCNEGFKGLKRVDLYATAEVAPGCVRRVRITPADSTEQAFAYTHLLPARGFYFYNPD